MRFKDTDISDAFVSGWGLRAQKECTTIDKVHSEQDQKNLLGKFIMMHYYHSGRLAWKSFLSTIDTPPGSSGVSNEAKSFTKHATGGLVR